VLAICSTRRWCQLRVTRSRVHRKRTVGLPFLYALVLALIIVPTVARDHGVVHGSWTATPASRSAVDTSVIRPVAAIADHHRVAAEIGADHLPGSAQCRLLDQLSDGGPPIALRETVAICPFGTAGPPRISAATGHGSGGYPRALARAPPTHG
jgi:hypothetical protein